MRFRSSRFCSCFFGESEIWFTRIWISLEKEIGCIVHHVLKKKADKSKDQIELLDAGRKLNLAHQEWRKLSEDKEQEPAVVATAKKAYEEAKKEHDKAKKKTTDANDEKGGGKKI